MIPKKVARIYKLIDNIALKGRNNILDYQVLIDDLVSSKDYDNLLVCLEIYYKVNIYKIRKVSDIKSIETWESILFFTNASLVRKLKNLFEKKGIYQVGVDVFLENSNVRLGEFREIGSYTEESRYLLKNKEYSKITKTRKDFVEVVKVGNYEPTLFDNIDDDMSEDENLYNRYVDAVEFLLL